MKSGSHHADVPSSIIYSPKAWQETIMGKALAKHPLVNYHRCKQAAPTPPTAFPQMLDHRPLAGVKIVEIARIIALPATGILLTAMGAQIVRVQSKNLPDFTVRRRKCCGTSSCADEQLKPAQLCLTQGKKTTHIDLDNEADQAALRALIEDADVILQGYRAGTIERRGFGLDYALEVAARRGKGICYLVRAQLGSGVHSLLADLCVG